MFRGYILLVVQLGDFCIMCVYSYNYIITCIIMDNRHIIFTTKKAKDGMKEKKKRIRKRLVSGEPDVEKQLLLLDDVINDKCSHISKEIINKISGYKSQDKVSNHNISLIEYDEVVEKLSLCDMLCSYCNKLVKISYEMVRDPRQWTLDRIDNDIGHSNNNTVIACLSCNIKRKRIDKKIFEESQNITVVKCDMNV